MAHIIGLPAATAGFNAATMGFVGVVIGSVRRVADIALMEHVGRAADWERRDKIYQIKHFVNIVGGLASIAFLGAGVYLFCFALVNSALIAAILAITIMSPYAYYGYVNALDYYKSSLKNIPITDFSYTQVNSKVG